MKVKIILLKQKAIVYNSVLQSSKLIVIQVSLYATLFIVHMQVET